MRLLCISLMHLWKSIPCKEIKNKSNSTRQRANLERILALIGVSKHSYLKLNQLTSTYDTGWVVDKHERMVLKPDLVELGGTWFIGSDTTESFPLLGQYESISICIWFGSLAPSRVTK